MIEVDVTPQVSEIDVNVTTNESVVNVVLTPTLVAIDVTVNPAIAVAAGADELIGVLNNETVQESNVTQHEGALSIDASQISDFDIEVSNNTSVPANTAKVGINTTQANAITANTAKVGVTNEEENTINSTTVGEPTGSSLVLNVVSLTQAQYDAGTPVSTTFYIITD